LIHFYKRAYSVTMSSYDVRKKLRDEYIAQDAGMDVQFQIGSETIRAHKSILLLSSDVFTAQFTGPLTSGGAEPLEVVVLKECSYEGFQNFLNIIYGVKVADKPDPNILFDTLLLAEKYQIDGIVSWFKVQLHILAGKKESALEIVIAAHAFKDLATFEKLCAALRSRAALTLHQEMLSVKEVYMLQNKLKDNPGVLSYLLEEMATVQEENTREKEVQEMELKNGEAVKALVRENNQLKEKYQVGNCGNCLEVKERCKDGQVVNCPRVELKVWGDFWPTACITEYTAVSVDRRSGDVKFSASIIVFDTTTPTLFVTGACKVGEKWVGIPSSDLKYSCH